MMPSPRPKPADEGGQEPHARWVPAPEQHLRWHVEDYCLISGSRIQLLTTTMNRPKISPFSQAHSAGQPIVDQREEDAPETTPEDVVDETRQPVRGGMTGVQIHGRSW